LGRLATSFILGYHGCERSVADAVVAGKADLNASGSDFDWLGKGVYFWDADPQRAKEWAEWRVSREDYKDSTVIGAVIDLGNCLDLTTREDLDLLKSSHEGYCNEQQRAKLAIAENKDTKHDPNEDRLLRYLDCAVINYLHYMIENLDIKSKLEPFDTVRGMFTEGADLYKGAGFKEKTHSQISVINPHCIKGYFIPR
jgi:hypothetical protein